MKRIDLEKYKESVMNAESKVSKLIDESDRGLKALRDCAKAKNVAVCSLCENYRYCGLLSAFNQSMINKNLALGTFYFASFWNLKELFRLAEIGLGVEEKK